MTSRTEASTTTAVLDSLRHGSAPDRAIPTAAVDLYWIPLGAGSPVVQANGRFFEAISALRHRRTRCDLYHAALQVYLPQGRFAIEQAPVPDRDGAARGVVATGPVGIRSAGCLRVFRYEVRCWLNGAIPDIGSAVDSPVLLTTDADIASRVVESLPDVPTLVWGRDETGTGEMWNSNSVISWVLARSGIDLDSVEPPPRGRAPGWTAGRIAADPDASRRATVESRAASTPAKEHQ